MIKYTNHVVKESTLNSVLKILDPSDKEKTLYISTCRQFIKVTKNQVYNIIGGNTSIPVKYLDIFNKEIITLNINDAINYIKSKIDVSISFKSGGLVFVNEIKIQENLKILITLKVNTIKQLLKLIENPDLIIVKLAKLKQDSTTIDYNNPDIKALIIDKDSIFMNLFLSGEMINRLNKLSSIGIIETCITEKEIAIVNRLQDSIRQRLNLDHAQGWSQITVPARQFNFSIANLFSCYGMRGDAVYSGVKLLGAREISTFEIHPDRTRICLNYIKYMGKFYDVTDRLEQIKLSII